MNAWEAGNNPELHSRRTDWIPATWEWINCQKHAAVVGTGATMTNAQPDSPEGAIPAAAADKSRSSAVSPNAGQSTQSRGDTESGPQAPQAQDSTSAADDATFPPPKLTTDPAVESAHLPPGLPDHRDAADVPTIGLGAKCVNEAACNALEKSWFDGAPVSIESCLESVSEQERRDTTEELVCIEMEFLWKKSAHDAADHGQPKSPASIEDHLQRFPELDCPEVIERLVLEEVGCRLRVNAPVDPRDYRQRFPKVIADSGLLRRRLEAMTPPAARAEDNPPAADQPSASERTVTGSRIHVSDDHRGLRSFGDYTLVKEIARGGMGVVFKARQMKLNRVVALKMILSGQLASAEDVQRFYIEAEAAASLEHPGIVPIYEIGEHDGQHFFSMGFIEGASLDVQVKQGPMPPAAAATIIHKVAEVIAYAHGQGVIHRDLKPANILLDPAGDPKVTDFGLAKKTEDDSRLTGTGQILGTPGYMPPEQASGAADTIGPTADIYSLGAILYALLTGRPPFQSATAMDTLMAVLEQEPVAPCQLNPVLDSDLETICLKCLHKDKNRRYATADALVAELGRYLNGEPILARPIGRIERAWRWCQRKPALAGLSVLAVLLLLTLGIGGPLVALQQADNARQQFILRSKAERALRAQVKAERARRIAQVRALQQSTSQAAATILREIDVQSLEIQDVLRGLLKDSSLSAHELNRIRLGLLAVDTQQLEAIVEFLLSDSGRRMPPAELRLIRQTLKPHGSQLTARLLPLLDHNSDRLRAGCLLAEYAADGDFWPAQAGGVVADLVRVLPSELGPYRELLRPVRRHLLPSLRVVFRDTSAGVQVRAFATDTLADYLRDDPETLFELLTDGAAEQFPVLFEKLVAHRQRAIELGQAELAIRVPASASYEDKEALAERQAKAAVLMLRMDAGDAVWPLLRHTPDSRLRTDIIHWLSVSGIDPSVVMTRFAQETDVSIRRALLLSLGEFETHRFDDTQRDRLMQSLLDVYRTDPDPGLHAAAEWLLRQWEQADQLAAIDGELRQTEVERRASEESTRRWYINGQGQTYVILDAGEFTMGNLDLGPEAAGDERRHQRRIDRRFAIASKEVTRSQFQAFQRANPSIRRTYDKLFSRDEDSPQIGVDWYDAAAYCNWLSQQEGIAVDQWCYVPNAQGKYAAGMQAKPNFLELTGYRLPTEPEWEYACRAQSVTIRSYGLRKSLLPKYAWYFGVSDRHAWSVGRLKPNDFGLFDMYGNAFEWCYDLSVQYPVDSAADAPGTRKVLNSDYRVLRGGSFNDLASSLRSANRSFVSVDRRSGMNGFRAARTDP